jgi:hypothetical protein
LLVREIQAHEIQTEYPSAQRLVMPFENRIGEIINLLTTGITLVVLAGGLARMKTAFANFS